MRHYYAARHPYNTAHEYEFGMGWAVYVFTSKKDRDFFVRETNYSDVQTGQQRRSDVCTAADARRMTGDWVVPVPLREYKNAFVLLQAATGVPNPHYWSKS